MEAGLTDKSIMYFVERDRARVTKLVRLLMKGADRDFLIFCIDQAVPGVASEVDHFRKRFNELKPPVTKADIEELM
jgi:hypothetical protein